MIENFKASLIKTRSLGRMRESYQENPGLLTEHLSIYRHYLRPEDVERQREMDSTQADLNRFYRDIFLHHPIYGASLRALTDPEWTRESEPSSSDLGDHLDRLNEAFEGSLFGGDFSDSSFSNHLSWINQAASVGISFKYGLFSLNLNPLSLLSTSGEGGGSTFRDYFRRRRQLHVFTNDLMDHLEAEAIFQNLNSIGEGSFPGKLLETQGGFVRFQDEGGREFQFHPGFLNEIRSQGGGALLEHIAHLRNQSWEEFTQEFPEENFSYLQVLNYEGLKNLTERIGRLSLSGSRQEKEEELASIEAELETLVTDFTELQTQVGKNGQLLMQMNKHFFPPSSSSLSDQRRHHLELLDHIEKRLSDSDLLQDEKMLLETQRRHHKESLKGIERQQINRVVRITENYIQASTEVVTFLAHVSGASQKTFEFIQHTKRRSMGLVLMSKSMALLSVGDYFSGTLGFIQGINLLLKRDPRSLERLTAEQTQSLIKAIDQATHLVIRNQIHLHQQLIREMRENNLALMTKLEILNINQRHMQRHLYWMTDLLERNFQKIREILERDKGTILEGQKAIQKDIKDVRKEIYISRAENARLFQHALIQVIFARASGFDALFNDPTSRINRSMMVCREDVNSCDQNATREMQEITKLLGEFKFHVENTLRSNEFSPSISLYEFENMNEAKIESYLEEDPDKLQIRLEDQVNLFPVAARWLNKHSEDSEKISEEAIETLDRLAHPRFFPFLFARYIKLNSYLPQNNFESRDPSLETLGFTVRTDRNEEMRFMCQESLKQRQATREMRKALPLAWRVYKKHLRKLQALYFSLKEQQKERFHQIVFKEWPFNVFARSPFFADSFPSHSLEAQASHGANGGDTFVEGQGAIPRSVTVELRDLLFMSKDKIPEFVNRLRGSNWHTFSNLLEAYEYKEKEQVIKSTCQEREWKKSQNIELSFPEREINLKDFWLPYAFNLDRAPLTEAKFFNCDLKGKGHHVTPLFQRTYEETWCGFLCLKRESAQSTYGTWVHYTCEEEKTRVFYDKNGDSFKGKSWKIGVYEWTQSPNLERALSSTKVMLEDCQSCLETENQGRCSSRTVFDGQFRVDTGYRTGRETYEIVGLNALKYFCREYKPKEAEICKTHKEESIEVREPVTSREEAVKKLTDLRKNLLKAFKKTVQSHFSGESENREIQSLARGLSLAKLTLVSLIYGGYGKDYLKGNPFRILALLKRLPSAGLGSNSQMRMRLLKRFPEDKIFSIEDVNSAAFKEWMQLVEEGFRLPEKLPLPKEESFVLSQREWLDHLFTNLEPEFSVIGAQGREEFLFIKDSFRALLPDLKMDLTFHLGFGDLPSIQRTLFKATQTSNPLLEESCLKGFDLWLEPEVLMSQFPDLRRDPEAEPEALGQRSESLSQLRNYMDSRLNREESEQMTDTLLRIQLEQNPDLSEKREIVSVAENLGGKRGLDLISLLSEEEEVELRQAATRALKNFLNPGEKETTEGEEETAEGEEETAEEERAEGEEERAKALKILARLSRDPSDEVRQESFCVLKDRVLSLMDSLEGEEEEFPVLSFDSSWSFSSSVDLESCEEGSERREGGREGNLKFPLLLSFLSELGLRFRYEEEARFLMQILFSYLEPSSLVSLVEKAEALGNLERGSFFLEVLSKDPDPLLREAVAKKASQMGGVRNASSLLKLSQDPNPEVVRASVDGAIEAALKLTGLEFSYEEDSGLFPLMSPLIQMADKEEGDRQLEALNLFLILFDPELFREAEVAWARDFSQGTETQRGAFREEDPQSDLEDSEDSIEDSMSFSLLIQRLKALALLGRRESLSLLNLLMHYKSSPSMETKEQIIHLAGSLGGLEGRFLLRAFLDEEEESMIKQLALAAGKAKAESILWALSLDSRIDVIQSVAEGAKIMGGAPAAQILLHFFNIYEENLEFRILLLRLAAQTGDGGGALVLKSVGGRDDWYWRIAALFASILMPEDEEAISFARTFLTDEWYVKIFIAESLEGRGELGLPLLRELLHHRDEEIRISALRALGRMGDKGFALLKAGVKDKHYAVQAAVAEAAVQIGGEIGGEYRKKGEEDEAVDPKAWELLYTLLEEVNLEDRELNLEERGDLPYPDSYAWFSYLEKLVVRYYYVFQAAGILGGRQGRQIVNELIQEWLQYVDKAAFVQGYASYWDLVKDITVFFTRAAQSPLMSIEMRRYILDKLMSKNRNSNYVLNVKQGPYVAESAGKIGHWKVMRDIFNRNIQKWGYKYVLDERNSRDAVAYAFLHSPYRGEQSTERDQLIEDMLKPLETPQRIEESGAPGKTYNFSSHTHFGSYSYQGLVYVFELMRELKYPNPDHPVYHQLIHRLFDSEDWVEKIYASLFLDEVGRQGEASQLINQIRSLGIHKFMIDNPSYDLRVELEWQLYSESRYSRPESSLFVFLYAAAEKGGTLGFDILLNEASLRNDVGLLLWNIIGSGLNANYEYLGADPDGRRFLAVKAGLGELLSRDRVLNKISEEDRLRIWETIYENVWEDLERVHLVEYEQVCSSLVHAARRINNKRGFQIIKRILEAEYFDGANAYLADEKNKKIYSLKDDFRTIASKKLFRFRAKASERILRREMKLNCTRSLIYISKDLKDKWGAEILHKIFKNQYTFFATRYMFPASVKEVGVKVKRRFFPRSTHFQLTFPDLQLKALEGRKSSETL